LEVPQWIMVLVRQHVMAVMHQDAVGDKIVIVFDF
jgi:hypothetical protein